jgi:uncharacterized membrane protein
MTAALLTDTLALGALSGMRSMAGPAAVAARRGGPLAPIVAVLALGEMIADKTPAVGDRTDPFPLAGRAVMGALAGGVLAHERRGNRLAGALVGAAAAVIVAHLAYRVRQRLPLPNVVSGLLEDGVVYGLASRYR